MWQTTALRSLHYCTQYLQDIQEGELAHFQVASKPVMEGIIGWAWETSKNTKVFILLLPAWFKTVFFSRQFLKGHFKFACNSLHLSRSTPKPGMHLNKLPKDLFPQGMLAVCAFSWPRYECTLKWNRKPELNAHRWELRRFCSFIEQTNLESSSLPSFISMNKGRPWEKCTLRAGPGIFQRERIDLCMC